MKRLFLAPALMIGMVSAAPADVLLLDAIGAAPANNETGVPRPTRGQTMDRVRAGFGEPTSVKGAIGEPPITRWVYPTYTVYFEHSHVIDVVVHR